MLHASHNRAVNGEKIDFSLLLDGLQAEREQGITIDIAWRYFETPGPPLHHHRFPGPRAIHPQHGDRRQPRRHRHPAGRCPPRRQAPDPPPRRDLRSGRHQEGGARRQQDGCGRLVGGALPRDRAGFPRHGRELQIRASHHHSGGGVDRRQRGQTLRADALVCRADLARASRGGRSGGRAGRRAVPHAGAARAARVGRFPRLCRDRHVGTRQASARGSSMRGAVSAPR